ncbi:MAG: hypothetical protein ABR923_19870 [Terracidiphilus sp.]|jgi:hypothetical protein
MPESIDRSAGKQLIYQVLLPGMATIALAIPLAAQVPLDPPSSDCSRHFLNQTVVVGQYTFKAFKNPHTGAACLEVEEQGSQEKKVMGRMADRLIRKESGQVVFRRTLESFGQFTLGQAAQPQYDIPKIENGADITGRGRPELIVTNWTGGSHCCFSHYVFELEPKLNLVAQISDADGDLSHFARLDGDRGFSYVGNDWTFAYWDASFLQSPAPAVVLHYVDDGRGGGFHLAMDKMQRPAPSDKAWKKAVQESQEAFAENTSSADGVGSELWSNMLDLIYTGHSDLAWKLYDEAWPAQRTDKDKLLAGFCSQLKTSPYWPDLQTTISNAPPSCSTTKSASSTQ